MPLVAAGQRVTASILALNYTASDIGAVTVTSASLTNLTATFTIPAGDSQVGNIYEIEAWGGGQWGSTQQALTFQPVFAGQQMNSFTIASGQFQVSANIRWRVRAMVICNTTGATGTFSSMMHGEWSVFNVNLTNDTGSGASAAGVVTENGSTYTVDTTSAQGFKIQAQWASTTGAPTITKRVAIQRKLGNG